MRALVATSWLAITVAVLQVSPVTSVATSHAPSSVAALQEGSCNICHVVPGLQPAGKLDSCADCHAMIRHMAADPVRDARAAEIFPYWERYKRNVHSYLAVPSLEAAMARLDPAWVRDYLANPHDLRPGLPETMPRLGLAAAQLDAIAEAFAANRVSVPATPPPEASRVARGERVFTDRACGGCHTFGERHSGPGLPAAPDLQHTRDRMDPDRIAAWIADPAGMSSAATMPSLGLSKDEVLAVRDYLWLAELSTPFPTIASPPEAVTRPVHWPEVQERVFGKICAHCHMDPEHNDGRRGPGNAGGFGFDETGIELETYEGVVSVAELIPDALARRLQEAPRDHVPAGARPLDLKRPHKPGMPLGLPPLPAEDHALVLGWIAQGMPR